MWHSNNWHKGGFQDPQSVLHYFCSWDTWCPTPSHETSTALSSVRISGIWSMLWWVMLWMMMSTIRKMSTQSAIRSTLSLMKNEPWYLQLHWRRCDSSRTGRCHLHWHHSGAMLHSLLQFSPEEMTYLTADDLNNLIRLVEDNNQYNDDEDVEFWTDILSRLQQQYHHALYTSWAGDSLIIPLWLDGLWTGTRGVARLPIPWHTTFNKRGWSIPLKTLHSNPLSF